MGGETATYHQDRFTDSLLPRFSGFYALRLPGESTMHLVLFENIIPAGLKLKEKYDLKGVLGSTRFVSEKQRAQGVETLKDRNFLDRPLGLNVGSILKELLSKELRRDVAFLEELGRIDYSLLLAVAHVDDLKFNMIPDEREEQWPTVEAGGIQSALADGSVGDEVFYMGIIDVLQAYTNKKVLENKLKTMKYGLKSIVKSDPVACSGNA